MIRTIIVSFRTAVIYPHSPAKHSMGQGGFQEILKERKFDKEQVLKSLNCFDHCLLGFQSTL